MFEVQTGSGMLRNTDSGNPMVPIGMLWHDPQSLIHFIHQESMLDRLRYVQQQSILSDKPCAIHTQHSCWKVAEFV